MESPGRRTFLVECYAPGLERAAVESAARRAEEAAAALRREGGEVEYEHALLVTGDEVVFHVFAAEDQESVRLVSERAALAFERIVESVAVRAGSEHVTEINEEEACD